MTTHLIDRPQDASGVVPADGENWTDTYAGLPGEANVSIILESTTQGGEGPRLHLHPYAETFIIRRGGATFFTGEPLVAHHAHAGQILVVEADTPHKFVTDEGGYEAVHIHAAGEFATTWLEPA